LAVSNLPWCVKEVYGGTTCFDDKSEAYSFWRESWRIYGIRVNKPFWRRY